jgi:signal transduction histidine kinase
MAWKQRNDYAGANRQTRLPRDRRLAIYEPGQDRRLQRDCQTRYPLRKMLLDIFALLAFGAILQAAVGQTPSATGPVVLTNAAQVRSLTAEEAARKIPIRVRGVVVARNIHGPLVILDDTAGLYVEGPAKVLSGFERGNSIEIEGVSDPGKFAPYLEARSVRRLGTRKIPQPQKPDAETLLSGRLDAQWIEVSGVVRRVEPLLNAVNFEVNLENGGGRILANAMGIGRVIAVDSSVQLRGVCFYQFNKTRQVVRPYLGIPDGEPIGVKESAPTNLYALPIRSVESLLLFNAGQTYAHRVRVRGAVIHSQPGEGFWIRDAAYGLRVLCEGKEPLEAGAEVDVFGFLKRGEYGPVIEDAVFQRTGRTLPTPPVQLAKAADAFEHDADLVACEAVIKEQWLALDGSRLKLSDGATEFPATLRAGSRNAIPLHWLPGSHVRVAGVCAVGFDTAVTRPGTLEPQSFQIFLRSAADVVVIQPPSWWTAKHVAWILGSVVGLLLLVVGIIVWISHRRLRKKAIERRQAEAEFSAAWNERNRMARELHDTLAQSLGAISLQLEVAKRQLPADSGARTYVEEAGLQSRASLGEVRNAIWNMRSQVLETGDLASALRGVLHSLTDRNHLKSEVCILGEPRRFAPVLENNLLRIGQEAIANAAKHARAKRIEVLLKFEEQQFELRVSDDGQGFDPAHPPASEGGFGLTAMHERAAEMHGQLSVSSAPGKGSVIKFTLPLAMS